MKAHWLWAAIVLLPMGCAPGNEADRVGVGRECASDADCPDVDWDCGEDTCPQLVCLTNFAGGYCGLSNCVDDLGCPDGSACVAHTDGVNYCFRLCNHRSECNLYRGADVEANCSSNVVFIDPQVLKACVPPSSG